MEQRRIFPLINLSGMCVSKKNGHLGHCTRYIYVTHSQELCIVFYCTTPDHGSPRYKDWRRKPRRCGFWLSRSPFYLCILHLPKHPYTPQTSHYQNSHTLALVEYWRNRSLFPHRSLPTSSEWVASHPSQHHQNGSLLIPPDTMRMGRFSSLPTP